MFKGSFTALITPLQGRPGRRKGIRAPGRVADRGGHARPRAGRHHRRVPHAEPRGAQACRRAVHQGRQEARAGDRRRRLELDGGSDRFLAPRQEGRRRRRAARDGLLQQADPGRPLPALQGDQRRGRPADLPLQRSRAHDRRYLGGDHGALRRAQERRRRQGCYRQRRRASPCSGSPAARSSSSSRARTARRSASWRTAAWAASPSPPTSRRACAPTSRMPASRATGRRRASCRID